jgi:hypothetical protein
MLFFIELSLHRSKVNQSAKGARYDSQGQAQSASPLVIRTNQIEA